MKYKVACCLMTHNHPDVLEDVLKRALTAYAEHGIDLCVCDDSDDETIRGMVDERVKAGADNLLYIDMHGVVNGDAKLLRILHAPDALAGYDYIWPCKDRVCFSNEVLDRLCSTIENGYDVIQLILWEDRKHGGTDIYNDPAAFYRDYAFYTTNWEGTIRRRESMIEHFDWDAYLGNEAINKYPFFGQTLTLFCRLAELQDPTMAACIYFPEERYMSEVPGGSDWRYKEWMYKLWIDMWIGANFSLPSIYDPYKAEALKKETNQMELFGSLEWMMQYREAGLFDREILEEYRSSWPFITDIPTEWLELVADGEYRAAIDLAAKEFREAFAKHDHARAFWLFSTNTWFSKLYKGEAYSILNRCFVRYRNEMIQYGSSHVFDGVDSVEDALKIEI